MESRMSVIRLSRGSVWKPTPFEPPYLRADLNNPWPQGTATATFYDTQGATLAVVEGESTPTEIIFSALPDVTDAVPAGANFEVFIDTDDGPTQVRYGKVIRREAQFFNSPSIADATQPALQFIDTFPTLGLRSSWEAVEGSAKVFDNSGISLPNGVGPRQQLLGRERAAIRWRQPLNSDSARVKVNLLNQHALGGSTGSKTTVVVCADQRFTSYLGVQFVEAAHEIHFCRGTGPTAVTYLGSTITNTVADGDGYTVYYDHSSDTISVFKGTSGTPLGSYTDDDHLIPHGPGYKYTGLAWDNALLSPGLQVTYWHAKDEV